MSEGEADHRTDARHRAGHAVRTAFVAFTHRNFRLFWFGQFLSLIGTWMQSVAQSWLVLELSNSPFQVGLTVGLQFGPVLLLGLFGGVIADRFDKRRTLLLTQSVAALLALAFGLLIVSGEIRLHHVWLFAGALGVVNAFDIPLRQSFVMEMVGRTDVMNALALNSSAFNLARIVGPAIGGVLIARVGVGPVILTNAASFAAVLASLLLMREAEFFARPARSERGFWDSLREGVRYAIHTPTVRVATALVGLSATFGMNFSVLLSAIARDQLRIGSEGFGLLMAAVGVGATAAALFIAMSPRLRPPRVMVAGSALFAGLELAFAFAARARLVPLAFVLLFGVGFGMILITAMTNTSIQRQVPDHLRGRVMSVYVTVFSGATPIGGLFSGWLAKHYGAEFAWGLGAVLAGFSTVWAWQELRRAGLWTPKAARTPIVS